ncbi:pteridine reductase [Betaproteobacteria bacterium]|nr:pteridine reductase [Betaproteobacteria bacterium]GHT99070.1 pteridine reductase [Betaproteobacteria bacterium]GHU24907.1 pteridine reductase [Betaproteobacteria bacterium]
MPASDNPPVILVTGAAQRIGAAIARQVFARGSRVLIHYRSHADNARALAADLNRLRPDSADVVSGDLGAVDEPERIAQQALARFGRLDALINNASEFFPTPLGSIDQTVWDRLVGSNFKGPLFLAQALAPALKETNGAIVNIIDIHAERPLANYPLYCATKAALAGLTRALALELAPRVRVNGISPGPIEWPVDEQIQADERQRIIADTLLQCEGSLDDIAKTAAFLVFDAPYITGQIIAVDGGRSCHL